MALAMFSILLRILAIVSIADAASVDGVIGGGRLVARRDRAGDGSTAIRPTDDVAAGGRVADKLFWRLNRLVGAIVFWASAQVSV